MRLSQQYSRIVICIAVAIAASGCVDQYKAARLDAAKQAQAAKEDADRVAQEAFQAAREARYADCRVRKAALTKAHAQLMGLGKHEEAAALVKECSNADPDLEKLFYKANRAPEVKRLLAKANDPKSLMIERIEAYEELIKKDPDNSKRYAPLLAQFQASLERQKLSVLRSVLRSEGVDIGMTRQQVLLSSWGKPGQINTTSTANGTHEQWVYNMRSYLYFENGRLTAIQN